MEKLTDVPTIILLTGTNNMHCTIIDPCKVFVVEMLTSKFYFYSFNPSGVYQDPVYLTNDDVLFSWHSPKRRYKVYYDYVDISHKRKIKNFTSFKKMFLYILIRELYKVYVNEYLYNMLYMYIFIYFSLYSQIIQ